MEQRQALHYNHSPADQPDQAASKRRNRRHSNKSKKPNAQRPEAPLIEAKASAEVSSGPRFYTSEERPSATIWARDSEDIFDEPELIDAAPTEPIIPEAAIIPPADLVPERLLSAQESLLDEPVPVPIEPAQPAEQPLSQADYNDYQPPQPSRSYFWNEPPQPKGHQPDREALPSVADVASSGQAPTVLPEAPPLSTPPAFDRAVNPNQPDESANALQPSMNEQASHLRASAGGLDRQAPVQFSDVEGSSKLELAGEAVGDAPTAMPLEAIDFPAPDIVPESSAETQITNETEPAARPIHAEAALSQVAEALAGQPVEAVSSQAAEHSMDQPKLLELAHAIRVDGVSAYEMFTAGRIDETGLRRIVAEFMRGGNIGEIASQELLRQQLRFERDPQLRDAPVKVPKGPSTTKRAAGRLKQGTRSLIDPERTRDRTARLAELTQGVIEKTHYLFIDNQYANRNISIAAIVVIYLAILIVALAK